MSIEETLVHYNQEIDSNMTNPYGNAHGGELVKIMDEMAALAARKLVNKPCVTAKISEVEFHTPIKKGDTIYVEAFVYNTGKTSLNVYTTVEKETNGDRTEATTATFIMVSIDKDSNPIESNDVEIVSDRDKDLYKKATNKTE